jgi:hypothetical protein
LLEIEGAFIYSRAVTPFQMPGLNNGEKMIRQTLTAALLVSCACASIAFSQGKGVDKQSERVRDTGSDRVPGSNGTKTDTGAGRGFDFGKGRTPEVLPLPNPYRLTARREVILQGVQDVMRDRKLVLDEAASRLSEGIIVSQPYTFIKGVVVSESELSRYANVPPSTARGYTRGRYTLTVEVQPIDGSSANISVNAKVEGRTDGATGAEWVTLKSTGLAEDEFLAALVTGITGAPPPGRVITPQP